MKVSNMLSRFFCALHIFIANILLQINFCMFVDRPPPRYPGNNPELNWCSEVTTTKKVHSGKQRMYFNQTI